MSGAVDVFGPAGMFAPGRSVYIVTVGDLPPVAVGSVEAARLTARREIAQAEESAVFWGGRARTVEDVAADCANLNPDPDAGFVMPNGERLTVERRSVYALTQRIYPVEDRPRRGKNDSFQRHRLRVIEAFNRSQPHRLAVLAGWPATCGTCADPKDAADIGDLCECGGRIVAAAKPEQVAA